MIQLWTCEDLNRKGGTYLFSTMDVLIFGAGTLFMTPYRNPIKSIA